MAASGEPLEDACRRVDSADTAAFVCELSDDSDECRVVYSNKLGERSWTAEGSTLVERIRRSYTRPGPAASFCVTDLDGGPGLTLLVAVQRASYQRADARCHVAVREWGITAAQTRVLGLLSHGLSNRHMAEELGCTVKTVEHHVHALLERSGARCRASLIASFWTSLET